MRVITRGALQEYWERQGREDAEDTIKACYRSASFVSDNRVVFNIGGNKHRLVVHLNYGLGIVLIKFVGSHAEYDEIDAATVGGRGRS